MKKLLVLLLFLVPLTSSAQNYILPSDDTGCPGNCRTIPWQAGSDLWNSGTLPNYTNVTCSGLAGNGTTNDGPAIQTCLNAASSGQAVFIPAGTYLVNTNLQMKNNVVLRGAKTSGLPYLPTADAAATTFKLGASGMVTFGTWSSSNWGSNKTISSGYNKGSTVLTMAAGHGFAIGNWLMVSENPDTGVPVTKTGDDGDCTWCGEIDGTHLMVQIVQVTNVVGNNVTINRPLYYNFQSGFSPVARTLVMPITKAGLENIRMDGSNVNHLNPFITMEGTTYCWVKGVETYDAGSGAKNSHVESEFAYGSEIRDNYFHFGRDSSSDRNYGIAFLYANSDHKVENNILRNHRHSTDMEGGGSGIAILYNYIDDNYTDDTTYLGSARANHGAHPYMNLYEGNIYSHITADSYWGSSSHNVFFRNWLWGNERSPVAPSVPAPNWGFSPLDVWYNQNYYSFVGNVIGTSVGTPTNVVSINWSSYTLRTSSCAASGNAIYDYGCNSNNQYSATTNSSSLNHGNWDLKTNGVAYWEGGSNHNLAASIYYTSEPSFMTGCDYPGQGPDLATHGSLNLPAYMRFTGGTCSGGGTTYTLSTATAGTGAGTVTGCAGSYAAGAAYSCSVSPSTGSSLTSVTGCGGSGTTTYAGTMPASNCTVTATFTLNTYTLTVNTVGTGSGTLGGSNCSTGTYNYNTAVNCTESPAVGSTFTGWSGGTCSGTGACTFNLTSNKTVTATFTMSTVATPTFSLSGGSYSTPQWTGISDATAGAIIRYTTDGTTPTSSSPIYNHRLYLESTQTIKAYATASGYLASVVATPTYTITPQRTANSFITTAASVTPGSPTAVMRHTASDDWSDIETARGTYTFTNFNQWQSHATAMGAKVLYTFSRTPSWANSGCGGTGPADPPCDINTTATCQAPLAGVLTTGCSYKEAVTKIMQQACGVVSQPANPLIGTCAIDTWETWNEINASGFWTGPFADMAKIANDECAIVHLYSGDTKCSAPSVSAGGDGFNPAGGSGVWYTALATVLAAWGAIPNASLPDAITYHDYGCRTTVSTCPMPTTIVSHTDANCTGTPNQYCRTAVKDMTGVVNSSTILQAPGTKAWSNNLPVYVSEGNWGKTIQMNDAGDVTPSHANVIWLRNSYTSERLLLQAAAQTPLVLTYQWGNDCDWAPFYNASCTTTPPAVNANYAWAQAYAQTIAWLAACPITGAFTATPVGGDNIWTRTESCGQYAFYDGWLTISNQATTYSSFKDLTGATFATGGVAPLTQKPIFLSNTVVPGPPSAVTVIVLQ